MSVGRLQSVRHDLELEDLAGETRPDSRRKIRLRLHRQRLQD